MRYYIEIRVEIFHAGFQITAALELHTPPVTKEQLNSLGSDTT